MNKQRGAVLIVSLLILLITTLLGVTAMQSTSLEMRMAKNTEERQRVFQATEAGLRRIENLLEANPYTMTQLNSSVCAASSDKTACYDSACVGGTCFFGDSSLPNQINCTVYSGSPPTYPVWNKLNSLNVWNDASKYKTLASIGTISFKYIVEFQCYVNGLSGDVSTNLGDALYRITVLSENAKGNVHIMLQSTYGIPLP